jgi:muramidase (phage lysozyme)
MALDNPLARQWLDLIAFAEGTDKTRSGGGYGTLFGGEQVNSLEKHPNRVIRTPSFPRGSAAAGRYQFMPATWAAAARAQNLKDFGPQSQDLAALYLLRQRGIEPTRDPINAVNIAKAAPEWASLPTLEGKSFYGQPVKSLGELQGFLQQPSGGMPYQVQQGVGAAKVSLPRYDFKKELKNIVTQYALSGAAQPSMGNPQAAQVYLQAVEAIKADPDKYGEEGLALAEKYRYKANEAMYLGGTPGGADPSKLVMDILGAKMRQKAYDKSQASQEGLINSQLAAAAPSATTGIDPNAQFISTVDLGKALQRKFGPAGLRIGENPAFGRVGKHSPGSLHYQGRALDITDWGQGDWKSRTVQLGQQLQQALPGAQIFHPGYDPVGGHHEHIHLGLPEGRVQVTPELLKLIG